MIWFMKGERSCALKHEENKRSNRWVIGRFDLDEEDESVLEEYLNTTASMTLATEREVLKGGMKQVDTAGMISEQPENLDLLRTQDKGMC